MNSTQESGKPQTGVESETKAPSLTNINREKSLEKTLGSLVENEKFPDVTFSVEGKHVPAHKFMLAARSPVFEAMLFGPNYKNEKLIPIEDISYDAFKCMLQYIYTSNPSISEQNVIELMYVAHKYDLGSTGKLNVSNSSRKNCVLKTQSSTTMPSFQSMHFIH